jgi:hypothetical protein
LSLGFTDAPADRGVAAPIRLRLTASSLVGFAGRLGAGQQLGALRVEAALGDAARLTP